MKNTTIIYLLFFAALAAATGCSKGEEDNKKKTPVVTGINPLSAGNNEVITITGDHFNSLSDSAGCISIYFTNKAACGYIKDDNTIEVVVPFGAGDGPVCVQYNGMRYCTSQSFNYMPGNPGPNTYMRLADCPNTPTNQVAVMVATNDAILAGFLNWWKYDIDKNTWTTMPAPTDKMTKAATFTFNGKAYVFGGVNASFSNRLQCYDPATNSWSFKAPMPSTPRADAVAFLWNNKAYIAGGADTYVLGMNSVAKQLWQYDPVADTWQRKADMPQGAIEGCYALRIGQKFLFPSVGLAGVQQYDPQTDSWVQFASTENMKLYAFPYSDKDFSLGYLVGGRSTSAETGTIDRIAINPGNQLFTQFYAQPPSGGYSTVSGSFYAVVNNELYYGMNYFDASGVHVQGNQLWRYRY